MSDDTKKYKKDAQPHPGLSLSEHLERIEKLEKWLCAKGINVSATRIVDYKNIIRSFPDRDNFNTVENEDDRKKYDELLYTYREIHELMWIQKGLEVIEPKGIDEKLKIILGGKTFARDDKDTSARNIQFELRIASYFLQHGHEVDLSSNTDISVRIENIDFYVECKRIYSESKVSKRIKEASRQLHARLKNRRLLDKKVGIAVFDVTKIAYPHQGLTWGVCDEHCRDVIQEKLTKIENDYDFEGPFYGNKNILGVWVQIHIPSLNLSTRQPGTRFSSSFTIMPNKSGFRSKALEIFKRIYEVPASSI